MSLPTTSHASGAFILKFNNSSFHEVVIDIYATYFTVFVKLTLPFPQALTINSLPTQPKWYIATTFSHGRPDGYP